MELDLPPERAESLEGRAMLVRKARVVPFECVVRGYLSGSALEGVSGHATRSAASRCRPDWSRASGSIRSSLRRPRPRPVTMRTFPFDTMASAIGKEVAKTLQSMSLEVYRLAADHAASARADPGRHEVRVGI